MLTQKNSPIPTASHGEDFEALFSSALGPKRGHRGRDRGSGEHLRSWERLRFITDALSDGDYGPSVVWLVENTDLTDDEYSHYMQARERTTRALLAAAADAHITRMKWILVTLGASKLLREDEARARILHDTHYDRLSLHLHQHLCNSEERDPATLRDLFTPHVRHELTQYIAQRVNRKSSRELFHLLGGSRHRLLVSDLKNSFPMERAHSAFIASFCSPALIQDLLSFYEEHVTALRSQSKAQAQKSLRDFLLNAGYRRSGLHRIR